MRHETDRTERTQRIIVFSDLVELTLAVDQRTVQTARSGKPNELACYLQELPEVRILGDCASSVARAAKLHKLF